MKKYLSTLGTINNDFFFFLIQDRNFTLIDLSLYVCEFFFWILKLRLLPLISHKHLYLWTKIHEPALVTIRVNDVHGGVL